MRRSRTTWAWFAALTVAAGLVLPGAPTAGATEIRTITVGTKLEAWYHSTPLNSGPLCESPVGCGPVALPPASPFPAGTLHVGVAFGQETSRAYITLQTEKIPANATLTGGVLRLPVAGPDSGTAAADTAKLVACFVPAGLDPPGPGDPVPEGSFEFPPPVDCTTRSPAVFVPATTDEGPLFTISMTAFAGAFAALPEGALALMPDPALSGLPAPEAPAPPDSGAWHVATNGRRVEAGGVRHIEAELTVVIPTGDGDGGFDPGPFLPPYVPPFVPPAPEPTSVAPPTPSVAPTTTPPFSLAESTDSPYAYPVVWLVPVALLLLGSVLGRSFTRPVGSGGGGAKRSGSD